MRELIDWLNASGELFCGLAFSMLIQSSLLIAALYVVDLILRQRVKAVFRYMIWLLVPLKLLLPPSLSSPISMTHLGGGVLDQVAQLRLLTEHESKVLPDVGPVTRRAENRSALPSSVTLAPPALPAGARPPSPPSPTPGFWSESPLTWQSMLFLGWALVVTVIFILLLQQLYFVRGLLTQSGFEGVRGSVPGFKNRYVGLEAMFLSVCQGTPRVEYEWSSVMRSYWVTSE